MERVDEEDEPWEDDVFAAVDELFWAEDMAEATADAGERSEQEKKDGRRRRVQRRARPFRAALPLSQRA